MRRFAQTLIRLVLAGLISSATAAPAHQLSDCSAAPIRNLQASAINKAAAAVWLDDRRLLWPGAPKAHRYQLLSSAEAKLVISTGQKPKGATSTRDLRRLAAGTLVDDRFRYWLHKDAKRNVQLALADRLAIDPRAQTLVVALDAKQRVIGSTHLQVAGYFDQVFAQAAASQYGAMVKGDAAQLAVWAPSAMQLSLCFEQDQQMQLLAMQRDAATGRWQSAEIAKAIGARYRYLVDVYHRGIGMVRHLVSDPYATGLDANGVHSVVVDLQSAGSLPEGWQSAPHGQALQSNTDMRIYELHVRDFSIGDLSVPAAHRGKYQAFSASDSNGMQHLRQLADAGLTDVHLLPVFDFASVPEHDCLVPNNQPGSNTAMRDWLAKHRDQDCFNWGYDPQHFGAPEGSYASDADDPTTRIREFRAMVQSLHSMGLRVGMDVVYNHTAYAGLHEKSVLDRLVPDYYHRLNTNGEIERSTCCENTATEHRMMEKLMIDTALRWVVDYRIDSFRFDLMGHQPKAAMQRLQTAVNQAAGKTIQLIGEGWNFGEVQNNARFVQASQNELQHTGLATFSDRMRDAARGGGCCDSGQDLISRQGWLTGLHYAKNAAKKGSAAELEKARDLVRIGMAGTLANYQLSGKALSTYDYAGGPAGYAAEPSEVVNYVENHDNPTLFDVAALKLPADTNAEQRARVQQLGVALVMLSQGLAYVHAGMEGLRSKSLDRNSYNSGDAFNALDWTFTNNHFADQLPLSERPSVDDPINKPILGNAKIKPNAEQIQWMRRAFIDWLKIRESTTMLRLPDAASIQRRLVFHATPATAIAATIDGEGLSGANFQSLLYVINVDTKPLRWRLAALKGHTWQLHPVLADHNAADQRVKQVRFDAQSADLEVPARTAVVLVRSY